MPAPGWMKRRLLLFTFAFASAFTARATPADEGADAATESESSRASHAAGRLAAEEAGAPMPGSARFKADYERMKCFARDMPPFNPSISAADPINEYWFALLNWLVYFPPEEAKPVFAQVGVKSSDYIQKEVQDVKGKDLDWIADGPLSLPLLPLSVPLAVGKSVGKAIKKSLKKTITADTEAYWLEAKDYCVLVFRGTEPRAGIHKGSPLATDVKTDIQSHLRDFGDFGKVHMGFYGALSIVWDDIEKKLASGRCKNIYITGHSLGGALARLAGTVLLDRQLKDPNLPYQIKGVITVASPRVGDQKFEKTSERQFRETARRAERDPLNHPQVCVGEDCRNHGDIVTTSPLRLPGGYKDSMHMKSYDRENKVYRDRDAVRKTNKNFLHTLFHPMGWYDNHSLDTYLLRMGTEMGIDRGDCLPPKRLERALGKPAFRERQAARARMQEVAKLGPSEFNAAIDELVQESARPHAKKAKQWPQDTLWYMCTAVATPAACSEGMLLPAKNYLDYRYANERPTEEKFYANMREILARDGQREKLRALYPLTEKDTVAEP